MRSINITFNGVYYQVNFLLDEIVMSFEEYPDLCCSDFFDKTESWLENS